MRPLINQNQIKKQKQSGEAQKFWEVAERAGRIEKYEEQTVFHLTAAEAEKCRFEITNQSQRMAECVVHTKHFSHGIRLHPPHLYKLEDGLVYFKHEDKWIRWTPNVEANKKRLENLEQEVDN